MTIYYIITTLHYVRFLQTRLSTSLTQSRLLFCMLCVLYGTLVLNYGSVFVCVLCIFNLDQSAPR